MLREDRFNGAVVDLLRDNKLDAVFLAPSADLKYVTGLSLKPDSRLKGLVLSRQGGAFFLCPSLYRDDVQSVENTVPIEEWADGEGASSAFFRGLKKLGLTGPVTMAFSRGIEAGEMMDLVHGTEITPKNGAYLLSSLRSVKSKEEQSLMRKASRMNDRMMEALTGYLTPGLRERDVVRFIMNFHESHGGNPRIPCVACGENSASPHYDGRANSVLAEQDMIMIDSGGWYDGYSHDMTRMFFLGPPTDEQRRIYEIVLEAQNTAEKHAITGAIPADLDAIARGIIRREGYGEAFCHRLGHGIGLDGHEMPYIAPDNRVPLQEGNCFSIEPGIYLRGMFGVRIENLVMLTSSGQEVLNLFPKEITVI